jgi:hypothetical protein
MKIGLMLVASSASIATMLVAIGSARAETSPNNTNVYSIEIVREPAINISPSDTCSISRYTCTRITNSTDSPQSDVDNEALLNDDEIGNAAIARFRCDCAGCRRAIAQLLQ